MDEFDLKGPHGEARFSTAASPILRLVIAWAIAVTVIWIFATTYGQLGRPRRAVELPQSPVDVLCNWDGTHYRHLAEHGYSTEGSEIRRLNFFPLFPAISYLVGGSKHAALTGILMNQLLLLGSMLLFTGLIHDGATAPLRKQPGFWLLISPFAFFLSTMYAESLFLFLSLVMMLSAHRRYYGIAFTAGVLAGLTRPMAICLPLLLVPEVVSAVRRRENLQLLAVAAAPLIGIATYDGAVIFATGDPLGYLHMFSAWNNKWSVPFVPMWDAVRWYTLKRLAIGRFESGVEIPAAVASTAIIILLVTLYGWRKSMVSYLPYVVGSLLFIHAKAPFGGTARYELVLFPVFLMAARSFLARPWLFPIAAAVSIAGQFYLFVRFAQWHWVA